MAASLSEKKVKEHLCDIGRRIWVRGLCSGNEGNHSARVGKNRFLVTPSGLSKGQLTPDDICTVDIDGKQLAGKRTRSSEFLMHAAIYKARPDVNAVVHGHPPHVTAFAIAGIDLPTGIHPEAEVFLGPVPTAKYVNPGDHRLGESILPYVKDANTILLQSHGIVCFDAELERCYYKFEIVDAYAKMLLHAATLGSIRTFTNSEMIELVQFKARFNQADPRSEKAKKGIAPDIRSEFVSRIRAKKK